MRRPEQNGGLRLGKAVARRLFLCHRLPRIERERDTAAQYDTRSVCVVLRDGPADAAKEGESWPQRPGDGPADVRASSAEDDCRTRKVIDRRVRLGQGP